MTRGRTDPNAERREFAARYASLEDTAAFAQSFCERHGFGRDVARKLALILEELLSNTIEHGFARECAAPIGVSLRATRSALTLLYEDGAPPFDPLAHDAKIAGAIDAPLAERPLGGLGVRLIAGLADRARYARVDNRNRLWVTLRRAADSSLA
jgi:serine/threonine-protein kinase RsbW/sigma-B regulation protein RsbU (phosphoserine phosphatase)